MSNWRLNGYDNEWLWQEAQRLARLQTPQVAGDEPRPVDEPLDSSPGPAPTTPASSSPVNVRQLRWSP